MTMTLVLIGVALFSSALTNRVRSYAVRRRIIDVPNERSLHRQPIPRGGGLGFVLAILPGIPVLWYLFPSDSALWLALLGSMLVAMTGWLDDRLSLSAAVRFVIHGVAALWAIAVLAAGSNIDLALPGFESGVLMTVVAWLFVVWMINLYNFMDGIDGLAAGHAVLVGSAAALLSGDDGPSGLSWFAALVAAGCAGFLRWNLPPARVFMGDVGSGFLGYVFAVLAIYSSASGGPAFPVWLLLLGVFLVDATATLVRRLLAGERWYRAHRSHAYQRAVQLGYSHRFVTITVLGITTLLGLTAWAVNSRPPLAVPAAMINFGLLLLLWLYVVRRPLRTEGSGAEQSL
jgi:Fuc2NAc and GlcNAc transferase